MSDTPNNADEIQRLLDNGWTVSIFKNGLGSYTTYCYKPRKKGRKNSHVSQSTYGLQEQQITDDFTPAQALYRLAEKMIGNIA